MENNSKEYYLCNEIFLDYSGDTDAEHKFSAVIIPNNSHLIMLLKKININKIYIPNIDLTDEEEINDFLKDYSQNVKRLTKNIWNKTSYYTNKFDNIDSMCGSSYFKLLSTKYVFSTHYVWDNLESIFILPNELEKLDDNIIQNFITILN